MTTATRLGILAAVVIWLMAAGLFAIVVAYRNAPPPHRPATPRHSPSEPVAIYRATRELFCPTDPAFLDSSPLVAPARFVRVPENTRVVIVDGNVIGKGYWALSAGGRERFYVYRDQFEQAFEKVRGISQ